MFGKFDINAVLGSLDLMWKGMVGIFAVIVIIMLVVFVLSKMDKVFPVKEEKDD